MRKIVLRLISTLFLCVVGVLSSCNTSTTLSYDDDHSTISIAYLRSLAHGISTPITENVSIEGYITANDIYGELYKRIVVEDNTGGIEINIDIRNLYRQFPLYTKIRVQCHGLSLGRYGSMIELGTSPDGEYATNRIPESHIDRYFTLIPNESVPFAPIVTTITALSPDLIGRTVRINNLRIVADSSLWCDYDPLLEEYITTTRCAVDDSGAMINIVTDGWCHYANETMPQSLFSLCGIVEYHNDCYTIRITNHSIFADYS